MRRNISFVALLCAVFIALTAQVAPCLADKRVALIIGNSNYKNTPSLLNPQNDAADVAQALRAIGFQVALKIDAEKRQMDQAVAQFARDANDADAALFYYAGHGMQFQGRNYVMPVDAELQDEISLRYEMTAIDDVKVALERSNGVKIMVLDSCRNNPLAAKLVRSISTATRDVPNVQGYARPEKTRGMIVVYATQADDVANDGAGRNSPFSTAFLKEIKEPGLEIGTMFRRIGADVYQATDGQQSPELSISLVPEYYLNQAETDQTIWARIRASADADTLREFLVRYPSSFYAPDAKARLDLLDREARENPEGRADPQKKDESASDAAWARARAAEAARAHEQALAAKLAEAEAERQKLVRELAQRDVAQQEEQRRAKAAAPDTKLAETTPATASVGSSVLTSEQTALVAPIQSELRRLGCFGGDGDWASIDMLRTIAKYARYSNLSSPPEAPSAALLEGLKSKRDRVCPSECSAREVEAGGRCVAKNCGPGEYLGQNGACVARPATPPRRVATSRDVPRAPAASKGHCFSFNGSQYCE
jgi:uncharacterized caspase-like protein